MSDTKEIYETLKSHVRDELYRVHVGGHGDGCPKCVVVDSMWQGCPVIDEYMVERVINTCYPGFLALQAAETEQQKASWPPPPQGQPGFIGY